MLPIIGLRNAAIKLEIPIVQVQYKVPKSGLGDKTSTKYLEKIKVIIIADQAEFAQSYNDHENLTLLVLFILVCFFKIDSNLYL